MLPQIVILVRMRGKMATLKKVNFMIQLLSKTTRYHKF